MLTLIVALGITAQYSKLDRYQWLLEQDKAHEIDASAEQFNAQLQAQREALLCLKAAIRAMQRLEVSMQNGLSNLSDHAAYRDAWRDVERARKKFERANGLAK